MIFIFKLYRKYAASQWGVCFSVRKKFTERKKGRMEKKGEGDEVSVRHKTNCLFFDKICVAK